MTTDIANINILEGIQAKINESMEHRSPASQMSVFNEFTKESDSKMIEPISDYLEKLRKGKPDSMKQEDYDRNLAWAEGVYEACKKRIEADDYN